MILSRVCSIYPCLGTWSSLLRAVTTKDGALRITLDRANAEDNHDLNYVSGMVSCKIMYDALVLTLTPDSIMVNTKQHLRDNLLMLCRNKFCFTGGILEGRF